MLLIALMAITSSAKAAQTPLNIVVTLPVLQDFVQAIGKERVAVTSLMTGQESEHTYNPKPSDILSVHHARILVRVGLGLENWVEKLIENAGNPGLIIVTTSDGIPLLKDDHTHHTAPGHHPLSGNPHIWLDPDNVRIMLRGIATRLIQEDPAGRGHYSRHLENYLRQLDRVTEAGIKRLGRLPDRRIITHHSAWPYFAGRFGLLIEGNLLHQVGSEPSAKHLARIIRKMNREGIRVIVSEPQLNPRLPQMIAEETGARVVTLTPLPGALKGTETYLSMLEYNITELALALEE